MRPYHDRGHQGREADGWPGVKPLASWLGRICFRIMPGHACAYLLLITRRLSGLNTAGAPLVDERAHEAVRTDNTKGRVLRRRRLNGRPARKKPYVCVLIWLGGVVGHLRSAFCLVVWLPFWRDTRRAELKRKRTRFFAGPRLIVGPRVASLRPRALGRGSGALRFAAIGRVLPPRRL